MRARHDVIGCAAGVPLWGLAYRFGTHKSELMCQRCPELIHQDMDPGMVFDASTAQKPKHSLVAAVPVQ